MIRPPPEFSRLIPLAQLSARPFRQRIEATESVEPAIDPPTDDVLAVNEALEQLERDDPRKRQIVNLRYFAGLSVEETAAALGISVAAVEREWRFIRAWLKHALRDDGNAR